MQIVHASRISALAVLLGMAALTGCKESTDPDCVGAGCASRTIQALVPPGLQIHLEARKDFELNGETVSLTNVNYGAQRGRCEPNCFSSSLCAIEDSDGVKLYSAGWFAASERPLSVRADCPTLMDTIFGVGGTFPNCRPPGLSHPVTFLESFQLLKQHDCGIGYFRQCFSSCCVNGAPAPQTGGC